MNSDVKNLVLVLGGMAVVSAAVIAGNAIYTNSKVGVDKKTLVVSSVAGIAVGFAILKLVK